MRSKTIQESDIRDRIKTIAFTPEFLEQGAKITENQRDLIERAAERFERNYPAIAIINENDMYGGTVFELTAIAKRHADLDVIERGLQDTQHWIYDYED